MNEINIIYTWKNKEVKTKLTDDEKLLLIKAIHSKAMESCDSDYRLLEEKIIYGLLGSDWRFVSDNDDIDELEEILEQGIDSGYKFRIDITLD